MWFSDLSVEPPSLQLVIRLFMRECKATFADVCGAIDKTSAF